FTLNADNFDDGGSVSDYALAISCGESKSKCEWATVGKNNNGAEVTFTSASGIPPAGTKVTVTARPVSGTGSSLKYEFQIKRWFKPDS
ncbi:hypothetical protein ACGI6H_30950, partial [Escherichia coli]